jgi:hypothetical protein
MENTETGNAGAWFNKKNWKDMKLVFDPDEQPPEGFTRAQPLHGADYQVFDEESGRWMRDPGSETLAEIGAYKAELAEIDREAGAGRAVRGIALRAAEMNGLTGGDYERLAGMEERAEALREGLASLLDWGKI